MLLHYLKFHERLGLLIKIHKFHEECFRGIVTIVHIVGHVKYNNNLFSENIAFGGRSPLYEALKECLQALSGRGKIFV